MPPIYLNVGEVELHLFYCLIFSSATNRKLWTVADLDGSISRLLCILVSKGQDNQEFGEVCWINICFP